MPRLTQIERRARLLLKENSIHGPAVNVHALAAAVGAVVREVASESTVSGALFRENGRILIGVNFGHTENRKRFTIAHELGHLLLHDDLVRIDHHYMDVSRQTRLRPIARRSQLSSEATDPREIEANRFAAALLMPAHFLESSLKEFLLPLAEKEIGRLAARYEVSVQAMTFRLINLGVPIDVA